MCDVIMMEIKDGDYMLFDIGGFGFKDGNIMLVVFIVVLEMQVGFVIDMVDLIFFVVDGLEGMIVFD